MLFRICCLLFTSFFINGFVSQQPSSAPTSVSDIYFANNSLWAIGISDQLGKGVYKYAPPNWIYFGNPTAKKITATASGIPFFINEQHNLYQYIDAKWNKIQENVTNVSGSSKSSLIWAIVNNQLMHYDGDKWTASKAPKVNCKDLAVVSENTVYILNSNGNIKKLNVEKWNSFGTKTGMFISAVNNSTLYLSQEIINPGIPNVIKCFTTPKWIPTAISSYNITHDRTQKIYSIDLFNRLIMSYNNTNTELTNSAIKLSSNNNLKYNSNPNYVDTISGETALFLAVRNNDLASVYGFLNKGANINLRNKKKETPLILAAKLGRTQIAKKITEISYWKPTIVPDMEQLDKDSKNALWYAVQNRDTLLVEAILERGANPQSLDFLKLTVNYPSNDKQKQKLIDLFMERGLSPKSEHLLKSIVLNHEACYFKLLNTTNEINLSADDFNLFLKEAIISQNKEISKHCINNGADPNLLTPFALEKEDKELMLFCLDKGAKADPYVDYAIANNDKSFMLLCIDKYKGSINEALIACCDTEKMDYATTLLEKGADANVPMLQMIDKKDTAFVKLLLAYNANANNPSYINKAIEKTSIKLIKMFLDKGANPNNGILKAIEIQSLEITSLLLPLSDQTNVQLIKTAASRNNIEILKLLLNNGSVAQNGLFAAISNNKLNNVNLLIEKGAVVDSDEFILSAIKNKNLKMVQLLVSNGASTSVGLELAVTKNASSIVEFLLNNGAEVYDSNKYIFTSVNNNYGKTLKVLIDFGFVIDFLDDKNNTMLHLSCKKGFYETTKLLIESQSIDINAYNKFGITPLMVVVTSNNKNLNFCKLLVENGANVNAKNNNGVRVRKMAKGIKVKKYLKDNGAKKR